MLLSQILSAATVEHRERGNRKQQRESEHQWRINADRFELIIHSETPRVPGADNNHHVVQSMDNDGNPQASAPGHDIPEKRAQEQSREKTVELKIAEKINAALHIAAWTWRSDSVKMR